MKLVFKIPLLLLAIGAFFLPLKLDLILFFVLLLVLIISALQQNKTVLFKSFRNILFLTLFTFPIVLMKLFTFKEGRKYSIWVFQIYSGAMIQSGEVLIRVLIVAVVTMIFWNDKQWFELIRRKSSGYKIARILVLTIELYEELIDWIISGQKFREHRKFLERLDSFYINRKLEVKRKLESEDTYHKKNQ